jgi:rhodanese-related sulfurtransferase
MGVVSLAQAEDKVSPENVTGVTTVDGAKAKVQLDKGVKFIDTRNGKDWDAGRIPGSVHLELHKVFNEASLGKVLKKDQEVVFYCNGVSCLRSSEAAAQAVRWGYKKDYYYNISQIASPASNGANQTAAASEELARLLGVCGLPRGESGDPWSFQRALRGIPPRSTPTFKYRRGYSESAPRRAAPARSLSGTRVATNKIGRPRPCHPPGKATHVSVSAWRK